jgi:2-dehydropantoate 2-reductase
MPRARTRFSPGAAGVPTASPGALQPIAVVGAGGVGGYFAGVLALAGQPVRLLARGKHLDAMQAQGGLAIVQPGGVRTTADVGATNDPAALSGSAFVIVAVKSYSLDEVAPVLRELAAQGAVIVPLLNGVGIDERLATLGVPRASIAGGLTYIVAARTAPGVVERSSPFARITIGEFHGQMPDGQASGRLDPLAAVLRDAGVEVTVTHDIEAELWRKLAFIAPLAAICGLARQPAGPVRAAPFGREVFERAVREVVAVGRASGVALSDADAGRIIDDAMQRFDALRPDTKPSLLLDVERGGPTELDTLSGTVARLGRKFGIETPVHDTAVVALNTLR